MDGNRPAAMMEVLQEDWLARIARFGSEGFEVETPEVLYISAEGIETPPFARAMVSDVAGGKNSLRLLPSGFFRGPSEQGAGIDPAFRGADGSVPAGDGRFPAVFSSDEKMGETGEIVPVGDALLLSREPRRFARFFANLRNGIGPGKLVYAPGAADPLNLALLCYFGVDLVDSYGTLVRSSLGQIIVNGRVMKAGSEELEKLAGIGKEPDRQAILRHNLRQLDIELAVVRDAIRNGSLRQLVELRARHEAWMIEALRHADMDEYGAFEQWTPTFGGQFLASSKESLWRPDIRRYRERFRTRYVPPQSPEILLLLPCSAKKPYSLSKTHRMFREAVRNSGMASTVHEVIVTSPLGIVPRELETVYPAQQYDIPVTGHWDGDEIMTCREMLDCLLSKRRYSHVIAHLDGEMEFLREQLSAIGALHTGGESVTKKDNLARLTEVLMSLKDKVSRPSWTRKMTEEMNALATYQFGEASKSLMDGTVAKGGFPVIKLFRGDAQLCSLVVEKGSLSLTMEGGESLAKSGKYGVEIEDFTPKTNIFAVGIESASPEIRIGDEVYVHHAGQVRAVGTARMNATSMTALKRGEAVHIRHHR